MQVSGFQLDREQRSIYFHAFHEDNVSRDPVDRRTTTSICAETIDEPWWNRRRWGCDRIQGDRGRWVQYRVLVMCRGHIHSRPPLMVMVPCVYRLITATANYRFSLLFTSGNGSGHRAIRDVQHWSALLGQSISYIYITTCACPSSLSLRLHLVFRPRVQTSCNFSPMR